MNISVILVGKEIIYNRAFKEYILRHLKNKIHQIDFILEVNDYYEINMLSFIKEQKSSQLYIFASPAGFNLLGKVISSELNCSSIVKEDTLIPEASSITLRGSYVIELFDKKINIISSSHDQELPQILLGNKDNKTIIHIFGFDSNDLEMILQSISSVYNVKFYIQEIVKGWQKVYITSSFNDIDNFIKASRELLSNQIIQQDEIMPYIIESFNKQNLYITFAESCTGGLISSYFTSYPSCSDIFELGIVSYSNEIKSDILDVNRDNLFQKGAVSEEVVSDMLKGAIEKSKANYAIAVSGVAGPSGGSEEKPIGTVYIGVGNGDDEDIQLHHFNGDRMYIQEKSKLMAIKMLVLFAKENLFYGGDYN